MTTPLLDMLTAMQNGAVVENFAKQYGLTQEKTVEAFAALMPAFSQGLKRNTLDPYGVANFFNALSTGKHIDYVNDMQKAFQSEGLSEGNAILGNLFGTKDVSRAVAAQAAQATGIAEKTLKQMLPSLADMVMGAMSQQAAMGQAQGLSGANNNDTNNTGTFGLGENVIGDVITQMMRQGSDTMEKIKEASQPKQQAEPQNPFDNPFGKMLEGMFGNGAQTNSKPKQPSVDNPLGRIFEDMMSAGKQQNGQTSQTSQNASNPYGELFGEMFESGRKTRDQYEDNIKGIFDQFLTGMDKR